MALAHNAYVLFLVMCCTACQGDPEAAGERASSVPGPGAPGGGEPTAPDTCGSVDPGFVGMRRLTRNELNATLEDLLGDASQPALALPNEDSLLASQATISALAFEKLEGIVGSAVDAAWQREANPNPSNRLRVCDLQAEGGPCAEGIVTRFLRRALRRPLEAGEASPFFALVQLALDGGDALDVGVKLAIKAALLDPELSFRVEPSLDGAKARALTQHELVSRLSFWLWGAAPDEALSARADAGELSTVAALQEQALLMLSDARAARLSETLSAHWLGLTSLDAARPSPEEYPEFNDELRKAMADETSALVGSLLSENRPASTLLTADYTFVDARLAEHYGLVGVGPGAQGLARVMLPAGPRRGILGHGSVLTMTSAATRTSPVKRGKWVFSKLLCGSMPPPPPMVDMLSEEAQAAETERERLQIHRANPACSGCHNILDPLGLGLENFDGIGRYRTEYDNGRAVDASGRIDGGASFSTPEELQHALAQDPRLVDCARARIFTHAVGREPSCSPPAGESELGLRDVIVRTIAEPAFAYRRGELPGDVP